MKKFLAACALLVVTHSVQALPLHYFSEIDGSGEYLGTVTSANAWANPPFGLNQNSQQINLWGLHGSAGQSLSVVIDSPEDFVGGFSLYYGEITQNDLLYGLFNNSANTGQAEYLTGTTPYGLDSSLNDITLESDGFYTLVAGGKGFGWDDHYHYTLDVTMSSVPEASSLLLLSTGLLGVAALRRRVRHAPEKGRINKSTGGHEE